MMTTHPNKNPRKKADPNKKHMKNKQCNFKKFKK